MDYIEYQEKKERGTFDFPIEYHFVDRAHPRFVMPLHWHLEYEFIRVKQGQLLLTVNEQTFPVKQGDCVLVADGALHGGSPSSDECVYECIVFDLNGFLHGSTICKKDVEKVQSGNILLNSKYDCGTTEASIISSLFDALREESEGCEFITQGLIFQFAGTIIKNRQYKKTDDKMQSSIKKVRQLKKSLAFIYEEYMNEISLSDLAKKADMSPKYFCRIFSQFIGKTPIEYINSYRIEKAAEMLLYTDSSVTEVALNCGFNDLSYFVKTFRKCKGITPKQFAKSSKGV